jgi:hypothetical protein
MNKIAMVGWESLPVEWWVDIADQLTASGEPWVESACLMDLRFWEGQVRLGRRKRVPSRRQLMKRWNWGDWKVRQLLRSESWVDQHHTQNAPKDLPEDSQDPPSFEAKTLEETNGASQNSPKTLPEESQNTPPARITQTPSPNTKTHPAGAQAGTRLLDISGNSRDRLWPELVGDLINAGYHTLEELAAVGRQALADDLGSAASKKRLNKIGRVLECHGLTSQPASQPDTRIHSFNTNINRSLVERYALPQTNHQSGKAPWDCVDYSAGDKNGK